MVPAHRKAEVIPITPEPTSSMHTLGPPDLVPLAEACRRLQLAPKTLRRLHRSHGLPLVRFLNGGGYFAFWSEIEEWARRQSRADIAKRV